MGDKKLKFRIGPRQVSRNLRCVQEYGVMVAELQLFSVDIASVGGRGLTQHITGLFVRLRNVWRRAQWVWFDATR
jgi:hypothetical protein